jgi:hypothetical protein
MIKTAIGSIALITVSAACWFHGRAFCDAIVAMLHH